MSRPPTDDTPPAGVPAGRRPAVAGRQGPPGPPRYALPLAFGLQAAISAGDGLAMVALASRVYQGSQAWAVAAVFLAITIPITALAPLAGLLLDRLPARPVLIAAAAAEAAVALALTRVSGIGPVLVLATGFGVCAAVLQPGLGAIVPQLVGPMDQVGRAGVTRANGYLQAATWGGFTAGPLLAAALMAAGGTGLALAGVAAVYALGTLGLWALPLVPPEPPAGPAAAGGGGFASQLSAGVRFLREDADAGLLVLVVGVMCVFANMAVVAEIAFAESVLKAGPTGYSVLVAAWTAGMLAGTLAGGRLPERRLAVTTLAGTLATGVAVALAGIAVSLWQAAAAYSFGGLANGLEVVATRSFLNHRAPAQVAGRVFAVYSGVLFGAASVGMAAAGGVLSSLNPRLVLLLAGGGGLVAAAVGWLIYARRHARAARSPQAAPAPEATPVTARPGGDLPASRRRRDDGRPRRQEHRARVAAQRRRRRASDHHQPDFADPAGEEGGTERAHDPADATRRHHHRDLGRREPERVPGEEDDELLDRQAQIHHHLDRGQDHQDPDRHHVPQALPQFSAHATPASARTASPRTRPPPSHREQGQQRRHEGQRIGQQREPDAPHRGEHTHRRRPGDERQLACQFQDGIRPDEPRRRKEILHDHRERGLGENGARAGRERAGRAG